MKLFTIKQSKGCRFMPKIHQNAFGGRVPPGPIRAAYALPETIYPQWGGLLLRGGSEGEGEEGRGLVMREVRKGKRPTFKGDGREGRKERGDGKGGEGNPPKSM